MLTISVSYTLLMAIDDENFLFEYLICVVRPDDYIKINKK